MLKILKKTVLFILIAMNYSLFSMDLISMPENRLKKILKSKDFLKKSIYGVSAITGLFLAYQYGLPFLKSKFSKPATNTNTPPVNDPKEIPTVDIKPSTEDPEPSMNNSNSIINPKKPTAPVDNDILEKDIKEIEKEIENIFDNDLLQSIDIIKSVKDNINYSETIIKSTIEEFERKYQGLDNLDIELIKLTKKLTDKINLLDNTEKKLIKKEKKLKDDTLKKDQLLIEIDKQIDSIESDPGKIVALTLEQVNLLKIKKKR